MPKVSTPTLAPIRPLLRATAPAPLPAPTMVDMAGSEAMSATLAALPKAPASLLAPAPLEANWRPLMPGKRMLAALAMPAVGSSCSCSGEKLSLNSPKACLARFTSGSLRFSSLSCIILFPTPRPKARMPLPAAMGSSMTAPSSANLFPKDVGKLPAALPKAPTIDCPSFRWNGAASGSKPTLPIC